MASFNKTVKSASLLCAAALMTAAGMQTPAFAGNNSAKNCENGKLLGTFAIQAQSNSKFVKKDDGKLRATKRSQPSSPSNKGVYELYSLAGMPGATDQTLALRSTRNPNKWWRVRKNNHSVKLENYQCRSDRTSTTFIGRGAYGAMALQSRKNDQWIYVAGNGKLKAASEALRNDSVFKLVPIGQVANPDPQPPTPDPEPQPPTPDPEPQPQSPATINGWFKGNNFGYYTAQSFGGSFQMKAFTNSGKLHNLFEGTITGNRVTGTWRNYCNDRSGNATLLYENGSLRRIAGNTGNLRWNPINRPTNIPLESQPSCNSGNGGSGSEPSPQTPNLIGWWKGNNSGFYKIEMRQEIPGQNNFTMKGYSNRGQLLNTFVGRTIGSAITGSWRNNCNNSSGNATLQYHSGDIIKVNGTATTNTRWSRTNRRPINLTTNCPNTGGGNQPPQQQATKRQRLTLTKKIFVYDQNFARPDKSSTKDFQKNLTVNRPERNTQSSSFYSSYLANCVGNTKSLDKDSVKVDTNGKAYLNIKIRLREGTSCSNSIQIGSHDANNFLSVVPGQSSSRAITVKGTGGSKVKITYTLTNTNQ